MIGLTIHKVILALLLCAASAGAAEFKVAKLFQDHMVLQRDKPIKIWGWADAGETILVSFASQSKRATADKSGQWTLSLDAMPASSGGRVMKVSSSKSKQTLQLKDVLVGEVWLCSGQSNMSYTMSRFPNCAADVLNMKYPMIRHFKVGGAPIAAQEKEVWGSWVVCSPETADRFSAAALYYAVELHKALGVPIGLINSSAGGTSAYQWSDPKTLAADPVIAMKIEEQKQQAAKVVATAQADPKPLAAYREAMRQYQSRVGNNAGSIIPGMEGEFIKPDLSDSKWTATTLPHKIPNGITWFAREVELPEAMRGKDLTLDLGTVYREESTYCNGVKVGSKRFYTEPSVHTIPASLTEGKKVVLSVRAAGIRGGGMSGKQSLTGPDGTSLVLSVDGWKYHLYAGHPVLPEELACRAFYGGLYEATIAPLIPYAIRGVIWYQGENGPRADNYPKVFKDLIKDWRRNWGQGDFPFYFCQLANYHSKQAAVDENGGWAGMREAQATALELANTGMACLIDVGKLGCQARDIHPRNNFEQGRRLALIARDKIYGEDIVSSGPMCDSMEITGDKILVKFKSVGSGLLRAGITGWYDHTIMPLPAHRSDSIQGFTIAGADGDFRMAHAHIVGRAGVKGRNTVAVSHPKVPEPKYVRFAWHSNPLHNLYNMEQLPAVPFRTDQLDLLKKPQRTSRSKGHRAFLKASMHSRSR